MRWSKPGLIMAAALVMGTLTLWCTAVQEQSPSPAGPPLFSASPAPATTPKPLQPEFFVMIDPSHGGDDKGAAFTSRIAEKDITLALARGLRKELQEHGIAARLLREGDINLSPERRAEISNQQRPGLYVALHAGVPGSGVRIYSAILPWRQQPTGSFLAWDSAQAASLERSNSVAKTVVQELKKRDLKAWNLQAFLRPLNNIVAPAIGVEIAVDRNDVRSFENSRTQNAIVSALALGIAQSRTHLGGRK